MFQDLPGFLFAGAGTLPGFLVFSGDPAIALLALVFLLLAGCIAALADPEAPLRTAAERDAPPRRD